MGLLSSFIHSVFCDSVIYYFTYIESQTLRGRVKMGLSASDPTLHCMYRAQLFDLAVSLLPGLDPKETDLLFVATEPALKVHELF